MVGTVLSHAGSGSWYKEAGWLDTFGGTAVVALWFAAIVYVPVNMMIRLRKEDEVLRNQYPLEWERWAKKTPYRVIPFIY